MFVEELELHHLVETLDGIEHLVDQPDARTRPVRWRGSCEHATRKPPSNWSTSTRSGRRAEPGRQGHRQRRLAWLPGPGHVAVGADKDGSRRGDLADEG